MIHSNSSGSFDLISGIANFTYAVVAIADLVISTFVSTAFGLVADLVGVSTVAQAVCAVVEYDAGESTLKMTIDLSAGQTTIIEGGSQYQGLMYLDLTSGWARRATLEEYMIAKVTTSASAEPSVDYTTRHIDLRML
jgi:hypothetical protein